MPREEIYTVRSPRAAAINFVTSNGRDRLRVTGWLNASRPSGGQPHYSYTTGTGSTYQTGKTGIRGYVLETGQSFTVRDDYDFANPGPGGKGYHVNAQLGDWMMGVPQGRPLDPKRLLHAREHDGRAGPL
ncbi:hypothetical protein M432DRAFT_391331 [Thermoascus aurantiacus ATCC 26904]